MIPGRQKGELAKICQNIEKLVNGKISRTKDIKEKFIFSKEGKENYSMSMTAGGIKKLGIYTTLINNRQLEHGTVLFLDEPEVELHPRAVIALGEMVYHFSKSGIQVFVSTHSYFLLKQLELIAF